MKIGFIDLYLSEWHANHYPEWLKQACPDCEVAYAWAEESVSPVDGRTSGEWCEAFGVTLCKTAGEVCERSDAIIVLAPSDPQVHLRLAELVLPYGKPTYMDKTFAPDTETAAKISPLPGTIRPPCSPPPPCGTPPKRRGISSRSSPPAAVGRQRNISFIKRK